jgi:6-phosphogluconolactonase
MRAAAASDSMRIYIGTYTSGKSKGIYSAQFNAASGKLGTPELVAETKNPSFLALHPHKHFLYAVSEMDSTDGKPGGAVSAFAIETKTGKLTPLNQQSSEGSGPCHLAVEKTGKCLLVANYGSGSIAALPIGKDGSVGERATAIQHQGSSVDKGRQEGPHAHFITPDPANHLALVCDLGLDKLLVYKLSPNSAKLAANEPAFASVAPGAGPRHLAFHPDGHAVYVINEMALTMTAFSYDAKDGVMKELQTISTLPADFNGKGSCAEVEVHPSGKFLYGSNRGHDSIAVFAIDPKTHKLTLVEHQSTRGKTPRHFAIDPTGKWLLAENQDSDSIVVFKIDSATGRLSPTGQSIEVGSPVCIVFAR